MSNQQFFQNENKFVVGKHYETLCVKSPPYNSSNVVDFEVWGTGHPIRQFLFANDIVSAVFKIIDEDIRFGNIIISDEKSYSIKEVVDIIISIYRELLNNEFDFLRTFNSAKPDGQYKKTTDTSRFQILVDTPITDLKVGLKLVIADYWKSRN